jgi:hypothetical protein
MISADQYIEGFGEMVEIKSHTEKNKVSKPMS